MYSPPLRRIHPQHPPISAVLIAAAAAVCLGGSGGATVAQAANPAPRSHRQARPAGACKSKPAKRAKRASCRSRHAARHHPAARPAHAKAQPASASVTPRPAAPSPAAVIASVLANACQNTELVPEGDNLPLVRAAVLCLINRERAEHGEAPLAANPELERAAEGHSTELVSDDYFAHVTPAGFTPVDRIRATGYIPGTEVGYVIGENLAWGTLGLSTPASIVAAWIASPGHLANILEAQYRETGIGIVPGVPSSLAGGEPGATYAQEFGVILR